MFKSTQSDRPPSCLMVKPRHAKVLVPALRNAQHEPQAAQPSVLPLAPVSLLCRHLPRSSVYLRRHAQLVGTAKGELGMLQQWKRLGSSEICSATCSPSAGSIGTQ